jgi:hypothetical protein
LMEQPADSVTLQTDTLYFMRVYLFVMMLCMGYALSQPISYGKAEEDNLVPATIPLTSINQGWGDLPSWQKEASVKAVEKYAVTQEKKWQRWNEAMFERSA